MRTKILLTISIAFIFISTSNAQIEKGNIFLGGGISYYSFKGNQPNIGDFNNYKNQIGSGNIEIGKVVATNSVAGIIFSYSNYNWKLSNSPDTNFNKNNNYGIGVFYRKYKRLFKNFYFFAEANGQYQRGDNKQAGNSNYYFNSKTVSDGGVVSFTPGISYNICKNFQLELIMNQLLSASYIHTKYYYTSGTPAVTTDGKSNTVSLNANLNSSLLNSFGIGFKFFIGK
jgi:hypothetical protein